MGENNERGGWGEEMNMMLSRLNSTGKRKAEEGTRFLKTAVNTTGYQDCSVRTQKSYQVKGPLMDLDHPSESSNVLPVS